jgi:SsrA-binding protein
LARPERIAPNESSRCGPCMARILVTRYGRVKTARWSLRVKDQNETAVVTNRKAYHEYFIEEKFEAGIVLQGTEVKSLRDGRANLQDSYASVRDGEVFLHHCHISPYSHGNIMNHDPTRVRKLLLHKKEIDKLLGKTQQKGLTLIPLRIYFSKRGQAKVELGLAKGKKLYDRRESIKSREAGREVERAIKDRR